MQDYSEKRDFHRMQVDARIHLTDAQGNRNSGLCRDLSATGMQVWLPNPYTVGDMLKTRVESAGGSTADLETICEVVRCEPSDDGYLLGLVIGEVTG